MQEKDSDYSFHIADLLAKFVRGNLSVEESEELNDWIEADPKHQLFFERMNDTQWQQQAFEFFEGTDEEQAWNIVSNAREEVIKKNAVRRKKRRILYATAAAACVLLLFSVFYYFRYVPPSKEMQEPAAMSTYGGDASPGYMHAELIMGGKRIALSGSINRQINGYVSNEGSRGLVYLPVHSSSTEMHMLDVPDKGTYHLVLEDGSSVWLNAGSSLRYPVSFTGKERRVELSGEAFFAVAKDKTHPFRVYCRGSVTEAVGTAFNINGYDAKVVTTLVEGKVAVSDGEHTVMLQPGRSAQVSPVSGMIQITAHDTSLATGWTKDNFIFIHTGLGEVLEQLSRWYGVKITYQNGFSPEGKSFTGEISRRVPLSKLLSMIELTGIAGFKISGNTLNIYPPGTETR